MSFCLDISIHKPILELNLHFFIAFQKKNKNSINFVGEIFNFIRIIIIFVSNYDSSQEFFISTLKDFLFKKLRKKSFFSNPRGYVVFFRKCAFFAKPQGYIVILKAQNLKKLYQYSLILTKNLKNDNFFPPCLRGFQFEKKIFFDLSS